MERRRRSAFCGQWPRLVIPGVARAPLRYLRGLPDTADVAGKKHRFVIRLGSGNARLDILAFKDAQGSIIKDVGPATCADAKRRAQVAGVSGFIVSNGAYLAGFADGFVHARLEGQDGNVAGQYEGKDSHSHKYSVLCNILSIIPKMLPGVVISTRRFMAGMQGDTSPTRRRAQGERRWPFRENSRKAHP